MHLSAILLMAVAGLAAAGNITYLYVASYDGNVTTLALDRGKGTLDLVHRNTGCEPSPSWLTLDKDSNTLYCLNEGNTTPEKGSLTVFDIADEGELDQRARIDTPPAPVSGTLFGNEDFKAYAVAHYTGQVSSVRLQDDSMPVVTQTLNLTMDKPGPVADRQAGPHAHQAILDPSGQYILVPDLGADLIRVYCWGPDPKTLVEHEPLAVKPGTGPRHAVFWSPDDTDKNSTTPRSTKNLYLIAVGEISNQVLLYSVSYVPDQGGLKFVGVSSQSTFYPWSAPDKVYAAEIAVSPDNRYLTISDRGDNHFVLSHPNDPGPYTNVSDTLFTLMFVPPPPLLPQTNSTATISAANNTSFANTTSSANTNTTPANATSVEASPVPEVDPDESESEPEPEPEPEPESESESEHAVAVAAAATAATSASSSAPCPAQDAGQEHPTLAPAQPAVAGGSFPRHFSFNAAGDLVAVALQKTGRVVVWERDAASGEIRARAGASPGEGIAVAEGLGEVTCVVWDE